MIVMGAGMNHWFHSDLIYRGDDQLVLLCGCQGVNGGGWAHYVGQEKLPHDHGLLDARLRARLEPPAAPAGGDAVLVPRDRPVALRRDGRRRPLLARRRRRARQARTSPTATRVAARLGWLPSYPTFDRNPLELADAAKLAGATVSDYVVDELKAGRLRFACEDPDAPDNCPRVLTSGARTCSARRARATSTSSSTCSAPDEHGVTAQETAARAPARRRCAGTRRRPRASSTCSSRSTSAWPAPALYSDIVLPAATWYEKHDISTTDLHPFVHPFNPAITPPWETRTDWDIFNRIAGTFSRMAGRPPRHAHGRRRGAAAARHPRRARPAVRRGARLAQGRVRADPRPDDAQAHRRRARLQPRAQQDARARAARRQARHGCKGITFDAARRCASSARATAVSRVGVTEGRAALDRADQVCEAILALSGTTNGRLAVQGFATLEQRTGTKLRDLAESREDEQITFARRRRPAAQDDHLARVVGDRAPRPPLLAVHDERRALIPWRTLTGRQHLYVDHAWMLDLGEGLALYRPPVNLAPLAASPATTGDRAALHHAALEVVDPLDLPGQPADADAVPRRAGAVDQPQDAAKIGVVGQRLGRDVQRQRRRRGARGRLAPRAAGHVDDVPRASTAT